MTRFLLSLSALALLTACQNQSAKTDPKTAPAPAPAQASAYDAAAEFNKFAPVIMNDVDTSFLSRSEKAVVNKLIQASQIMTQIYQRQITPDYDAVQTKIANSGLENAADLTQLFNLYFKPCSELEHNQPFFGGKPCPEGAGFYPEDMTREEFNQWIKDHPQDEAAFKSGYTLIRRNDDGLVAIPYSQAFKTELEQAAKLLREAAEISEEPSLKNFLNLRADAFLNDDYFASEMAWMDLEGNIEIAIGPYEVYDDGLFNYKTAYESFVTIKNPEESAALDKYKNYLRDMEANLPVPDSYKNFQRGFESPIAVTYQVQGGGDNVNGVQTIAFNLPNDERVREAKGAKKVILNNVLGAKYDRILAPIAQRLLIDEQAAITDKKFMSYGTLFHELCHSLGPGSITKDGVKTTVAAEMKELYSGLEEGKADVMGAYNLLYMIERGEIPQSEREPFLATYFAGLFRSMRFGIGEAHGKGAAVQYSFFREAGAVEWDENLKRFRVDYPKLEQAISDLTAKFVIVQGDGDYDAAKDFLDQYAKKDAIADQILSGFDDIPVDIRPVYPKKI